MRAFVLVALAGCASINSDKHPKVSTQIAATAGGFAIAGLAFAGAKYSHDESPAYQGTIAVSTSVVPMGALFLGEDSDEDVSTPGGIYSAMGRGLGEAFGASLSFAAPMIGTIVAGNDVERDSGAKLGTVGGILLGSAISVGLSAYLPKWGRVVVGALVTGASATLGYQVGGGGR